MAYLLDTNAFIEARKRWYGFDFCPAYWAWLQEAHASGVVYSIEKVADEILAGDDELVAWVREQGSSFFVKPDAAVVHSLAEVSAWAAGGDYDPAAVTTFLEVADSYLVAHAHAHDHVVVTHEVIKNSRKTVQIPEACVAIGVKCMNTFEMLRVEKARFVLGS
jgi:predicted nucleic acid-binding protein